MHLNCNNANIWLDQSKIVAHKCLVLNILHKFQEEQNFVKRLVFKRATRQNKTIHVCTCSGPNKNIEYWSFKASQKNWRIQINSAVCRWPSCSYISATFTQNVFSSLTLYRYLSNFYTDHDFLWGKKCGEGDKSCHRKQGQERTRALEISNKYKKES